MDRTGSEYPVIEHETFKRVLRDAPDLRSALTALLSYDWLRVEICCGRYKGFQQIYAISGKNWTASFKGVSFATGEGFPVEAQACELR